MKTSVQPPLMGRMMDEPLMISSIIRFAARHDGSSEIVARRVEGDVHRYTVRDCEARARRLANVLRDGWFPTGDVATIDADGFMQITDRSKDVIKSGGERIGSIDLENIALAHPAVLQAACIAMRHPKWDERPLPVVVRRPEAAITREEPLRFFEGKVARFWMPDDVVFVETLPTGATGKVQKNRLREQFGDYLQRDVPGWPAAPWLPGVAAVFMSGRGSCPKCQPEQRTARLADVGNAVHRRLGIGGCTGGLDGIV